MDATILLVAFLVQNPKEVGPFCVRVQQSMFSNVDSVSLGEGYQIDLGFNLLEHFLEYNTNGCSSQGLS